MSVEQHGFQTRWGNTIVDMVNWDRSINLDSSYLDLYTAHAKSINSIMAECENHHEITMNRYNLNISIYSIMLLRIYDPTESTNKNYSIDSIKSIDQLIIYVDILRKTFNFADLFGKTSISLTFFRIFLINWTDSIISVA